MIILAFALAAIAIGNSQHCHIPQYGCQRTITDSYSEWHKLQTLGFAYPSAGSTSATLDTCMDASLAYLIPVGNSLSCRTTTCCEIWCQKSDCYCNEWLVHSDTPSDTAGAIRFSVVSACTWRILDLGVQQDLGSRIQSQLQFHWLHVGAVWVNKASKCPPVGGASDSASGTR